MKKILFIASLFIATPLYAASAKNGGIELSADTLQYNQKTEIVTAQGSVVAKEKATGELCNLSIKKKNTPLSQAVGGIGQETSCSRTLKADKIIYDRKAK